MSSNQNTRKFGLLGTTAVAALVLAAVAVPLTPAKAFVDVEVGPVGIGVPGPFYDGPAYYRPWHHHYGYYGYYGPRYYDYGW